MLAHNYNFFCSCNVMQKKSQLQLLYYSVSVCDSTIEPQTHLVRVQSFDPNIIRGKIRKKLTLCSSLAIFSPHSNGMGDPLNGAVAQFTSLLRLKNKAAGVCGNPFEPGRKNSPFLRISLVKASEIIPTASYMSAAFACKHN